ncbi:MAG: thiol-disulfide oxidoreductase DCC family protein [Bdellovibrio sp.]|jgi:predicted DCC family thiol-disulfide oxidoreductase YuxK
MAVSKNKSELQPGIIFYDGLCRACSAEINHYRRLPGSEHFEFLDITRPDFKAETFGIDPQRVHKFMHVQDAAGTMHEGVDAFVAIWSKIPRYHFAARWAKLRPVRAALELGYQGFVVIRPYLPRKKSDCSASPYCEVPK